MLNIPNVFTQGAMKVLVQAQISAASMGFSAMGTEHLLIGLYKSGDELTKLILNDISSEQIEREVLAQIGRGDVGFSRVVGLSTHAQCVLRRAIAYADPQKRMLAGVAHIWQELLYEEGCRALSVLLALGRSVDALRTALANAAGEIKRPAGIARITASSGGNLFLQRIAAGREEAQQEGEADKKENPLDVYGRNLTKAASEDELEPLIGREDELESIVQVLGKKTKNNPLLIGEPGVGKSALVEGIARRIAVGDVPPSLLNAQIYALDLAQMVAGSKYRGEFEERIKSVIAAASKAEHVILFIDEMHTLIGAGGSQEGTLDAANILKPALARGRLRVIGATTYREYRKYIEKDAALARRFQRIDVREPDGEQTLQILMGLRERLEAFHNAIITDEALGCAVELSARYVTDRFMPDKAIDLIDEAASMATIDLWRRRAAAPTLDRAREQACEPLDPQENALMPTHGVPEAIIRSEEIARVVAQWTGIPVERVGTAAQQDILTLEERLNARVIGQRQAVASVIKALRRARAGLNDPTRPMGVFMLLGPSGVGKTELCKALSEALFGSEEALVRIDMSEYSEEATASRLIGSPPGYIGHGEGGQLTDAVLKRPYSVVLFDEIEKAHPKIYSLLLQLLDDGQLTDSVGRKVNFRNTIVIMTSNAGVSFDMDKRLGFAGGKEEIGDHSRSIMAQVKQTFRPEFLGRIDEMIVMNRLNADSGARIAALMLARVQERIAKRGVTLTFDEKAPALLADEGISAMEGARGLRRVIEQRVEDPLSDMLLLGQVKQRVHLSTKGDELILCPQEEALVPV